MSALLIWRACYAKPGILPDIPIETHLLVRAPTVEEARRLAADVFEQVYKYTPASAGFELGSVELLR